MEKVNRMIKMGEGHVKTYVCGIICRYLFAFGSVGNSEGAYARYR